ncbi:MAG TPA: zinc-binding dehydrogenase [Terracidiphilus sp.]
MLIADAGPIGIMAIPVVRHAGARHVVITDLNPYRLDLARKVGATLAVNPRDTALQEVQKQLGIAEGFDVGLEVSGNAQALRDMIANMSLGGKIAILGIPPNEIHIDWRQVGDLQHADHQSHLRPRNVLDMVQDVGHARIRRRHRPVITHRFPYHEFQKDFAPMLSGQTGKVILDWSSDQWQVASGECGE